MSCSWRIFERTWKNYAELSWRACLHLGTAGLCHSSTPGVQTCLSSYEKLTRQPLFLSSKGQLGRANPSQMSQLFWCASKYASRVPWMLLVCTLYQSTGHNWNVSEPKHLKTWQDILELNTIPLLVLVEGTLDLLDLESSWSHCWPGQATPVQSPASESCLIQFAVSLSKMLLSPPKIIQAALVATETDGGVARKAHKPWLSET